MDALCQVVGGVLVLVEGEATATARDQGSGIRERQRQRRRMRLEEFEFLGGFVDAEEVVGGDVFEGGNGVVGIWPVDF